MQVGKCVYDAEKERETARQEKIKCGETWPYSNNDKKNARFA